MAQGRKEEGVEEAGRLHHCQTWNIYRWVPAWMLGSPSWLWKGIGLWWIDNWFAYNAMLALALTCKFSDACIRIEGKFRNLLLGMCDTCYLMTVYLHFCVLPQTQYIKKHIVNLVMREDSLGWTTSTDVAFSIMVDSHNPVYFTYFWLFCSLACYLSFCLLLCLFFQSKWKISLAHNAKTMPITVCTLGLHHFSSRWLRTYEVTNLSNV